MALVYDANYIFPKIHLIIHENDEKTLVSIWLQWALGVIKLNANFEFLIDAYGGFSGITG